ncbi:MAG: molybdenum cofactor guanylyltransferase, partial [Chloroflexota bacterium]|nr:molybdenum cofactor guanylyltransferase [Chloroflexota bacterium]
FHQKKLLDRVIGHLNELGQEVILVLAQQQSNPCSDCSQQVKIARDQLRGKGPLVGIYSGLKASGDEYSMVVACDMPFLNIGLINYMIGLAPDFDIVIPRVGELVEPLHAVYSRNCLNIMEKMIGSGNLKISNLLEQTRVRYVEKEEIDRFDPEHLSFFNINTPDDVEKAEKIIMNPSPLEGEAMRGKTARSRSNDIC